MSRGYQQDNVKRDLVCVKRDLVCVKRDLETDLLRSKRDLLALAYTPEMYESGQRSQLVCAVRFEYFPAGHACGHHRDDVCVRECVCVSVRV